MNKNSKIFIAGHRGMVGSAILRNLISNKFSNLITINSEKLDLMNQKETESFFNREKPDYVFNAAAKVGGILANLENGAQFIYENLQIQNNIIHSSYLNNVKKLLFLGSSCIYPKFADQPIKEESLLSGYLEKTNEPYAISKIAGIKMCQSYNNQYGTNFISVMPTNLYGPNDNFDLNTSHVLPCLIRKFYEAKKQSSDSVEIWGTGNPLREFLHVDDLAKACVFLMIKYKGNEPINVGTGKDISIKDLAALIKDIIQYNGNIVCNKEKPDGTPRKLLNINKILGLGWEPKIDLKTGILDTYKWYKENNQFL